MGNTTNNSAFRSRYKSRSGKPWSGADISRLIVMAEHQVPAKRIAAKLRRSEGAVRAEAARQRVLLPASDPSPTAKQPYGGVTARAARAPRNHRAPSLTRARAQAPGRRNEPGNEPGNYLQDTLF
jgi:hypothetical protein